jgi:hypothetical protein
MRNFFSLLSDVSSNQIDNKNYVFTYSNITGIGEESGVSRRDPSDIFKIGNTYYVYYSYEGTGITPPGYNSTVYLAKSTDTVSWTELGEAIPRGTTGQWDEYSTFTPNVLILDNIVYVYYTSVDAPFDLATSKTRMGVAWQTVENIETFPYIKSIDNPLIEPSETASDFDSMRIDDAQMIIQGSQIYFYYKGRKLGETPNQTRHGLAISATPLSGFVKYFDNPIYNSGHEVMIFRYGSHLRSLISHQGFDASLHDSVLDSANGLTDWNIVKPSITPPYAGGYYREDNFTNQYNSKNLTWGISTDFGVDGLPHLRKFIVS